MVISLHLVEEDFGFGGVGMLDEAAVNDVEDIIAEAVEFGLDFALVGLDERKIFL